MKKLLIPLSLLIATPALALLTSGNVNINVDGKTTVTGGTIAAVDEDGNNTGNLNLSTNELEYNDIKDFNTSEESGFGISTSFGKNNDKGEWNAHPSGTTTVSMTDKGNETEQTTHATIGSGNISVDSTTLDDNDESLADLNRDIDNAQEITKDQITGALDGSVTIDNRILTEEGRDDIAKQHEKLGDNIAQIGDGLRNNIVVKSVENYVTDDTKSLVDTVNDYIEQDRQMTEMMEKQKDLVAGLNGLTNMPAEEAQQLLQEVADFVAGTDGFTGDLKLADLNVEGGLLGLAYQSNDGTVKNITINLSDLDPKDPNALMKAIYHETTNFDQHGRVDANGNKIGEITADNRGTTGAAIFDLKNFGNTNTNDQNKTTSSWISEGNNSSIINTGSERLLNDINSHNNNTGTGNATFVLAMPPAVATPMLSANPIVLAARPTPIVRPILETATKAGLENAVKTTGETVGKVATENLGKTAVEGVGKSATDTLFKNGRPLGDKGTAKDVRTLPKNEFQQTKTDLLKGAEEISPKPGYSGKTYRAPDGTEFGIRESHK